MKNKLSTLLLLLALLPFTSGCTEEEKAEAKELWLGIPNRTSPPVPSFLDIKESDPHSIKRYKEAALAARESEYRKMTSRGGMMLFAERADTLDVNNIRDLLYSRSAPGTTDTRFSSGSHRPSPPPQRRYTPMDFQQGTYGDMYRAGGAMQDLGAAMMAHDVEIKREKAIAQARIALNSYILQMEQVKYELLHD